jgi:hypothetical protein
MNISYEADRWTAMEISLNFRQGKFSFHLLKGFRGPRSPLSPIFKKVFCALISYTYVYKQSNTAVFDCLLVYTLV